MQVTILQDCIKVHVKSTKGPIDVYLCDVEQDKPGDKTSGDKEAVTSETEPSVPPGEGNISRLHFYPHVIFFFIFKRLSYSFQLQGNTVSFHPRR